MGAFLIKEEERVALSKGEFFPGRPSKSLKEQSREKTLEVNKCEIEIDNKNVTIEEAPTETVEASVLAYQKYFFYLQGPLVSSSVKFSEKKSIIGDDDDD